MNFFERKIKYYHSNTLDGKIIDSRAENFTHLILFVEKRNLRSAILHALSEEIKNVNHEVNPIY